jgi:hypothetical protein
MRADPPVITPDVTRLLGDPSRQSPRSRCARAGPDRVVGALGLQTSPIIRIQPVVAVTDETLKRCPACRSLPLRKRSFWSFYDACYALGCDQALVAARATESGAGTSATECRAEATWLSTRTAAPSRPAPSRPRGVHPRRPRHAPLGP